MSIHLLLLIICLFFTPGLFLKNILAQDISSALLKANISASKLSTGEGKFLTRETDNQEDVKKVLFFLAFKDLLSKELKTMNSDASLFWKKFEEKYELSVSDQKKDFIKKLEEEYKGDDPKERKEKIEREWIIHTANSKVEFMGLSNILSAYNIIRLNRSPQNPLMRYMTIQGEVGTPLLGQLYRKTTQEGAVKEFRRVFLNAKFDLNNCTWNELGVDSENDFTKVVKAHWLEWLKNNLKGDIVDFELADENKLRNIEEEIKDLTEKTPEQKWEALVSNEWSGEYSDAILLKINIVIRKNSENSLSQTRNIEVSTDFVVKAIGPNYVVLAEDIQIPRKESSIKDSQNYSSALATSVYQSPLGSLGDLKRSLQSISPSYRVLKFEVSNTSTLSELTKIKEYVENLNPGRQVKSSIVSQNGKKAVMELKINGSKDEILRFLNSLDNARIAEGKVLSVRNKNTPYMLELKDVSLYQNKP